MNPLTRRERFRLWIDKRRGHRRLARGYCPLCNSSPPDPECAVCRGTRDYGPEQTPREHAVWQGRWYEMVGYPRPTTKALVRGYGIAPSAPPPPAPRLSTAWRCEECGAGWLVGSPQCHRCGNRTRERTPVG